MSRKKETGIGRAMVRGPANQSRITRNVLRLPYGLRGAGGEVRCGYYLVINMEWRRKTQKRVSSWIRVCCKAVQMSERSRFGVAGGCQTIDSCCRREQY